MAGVFLVASVTAEIKAKGETLLGFRCVSGATGGLLTTVINKIIPPAQHILKAPAVFFLLFTTSGIFYQENRGFVYFEQTQKRPFWCQEPNGVKRDSSHSFGAEGYENHPVFYI